MIQRKFKLYLYYNWYFMQQLRGLIARKDELEKEIQKLTKEIELIDEVKSFNKGLVDSEGYPRADIDFGELTNYRNLKRRKAEINNDHLALMKEIENKLFAYHSTLPKVQHNYEEETTQQKTPNLSFKKKQVQENVKPVKITPKIDYLTPFAKISVVFEKSPAESAGLKVGDLVSEFADVTIYSMDWIKQLGQIVREGEELKVVILRPVAQQKESKGQVYVLKDGNAYQKLRFSLIPSKWQGKGLLGCKIDPIK